MFMSEPKEPHHFGSDLDIRLRPFADQRKYLELFHRAGDGQRAGEASVMYLYSKTAPREIQELSPSARIIVMLRDPVEMVSSLHAHNLMAGYEDLLDLEQALASEEERRQGRMISTTCILPGMLQYRALGKYTEHVRRYQEIFGRDRVRCILFDDLKNDPQKTYLETLAFLGLEPAAFPEFKAHNERQQWRNRRTGRAMLATILVLYSLCSHLPTRAFRKAVRSTLGLPYYVLMRTNLTKAPPSRLSPQLRDRLRETFREDVEALGRLLDRDLSSWCQPEPARLVAAGEPVAAGELA